MPEIEPHIASLCALNAPPRDLYAAVSELSRCASKSNAYKAAIREAGGIEHLVKMLKHDVRPEPALASFRLMEEQFELMDTPSSIANIAALALSKLATDVRYRAAIVAAGGVHALVALARDRRGREWPKAALQRLARDEHTRVAIQSAQEAVASAVPARKRRCSRCSRPCPSAEGPAMCASWGCARPGDGLCRAHMREERWLKEHNTFRCDMSKHVPVGACDMPQCSYANGGDMRANLQEMYDRMWRGPGQGVRTHHTFKSWTIRNGIVCEC